MDLESMVSKGENILWKGRPDRKCFAFECIFNPLLPFALIWAVIDLSILAFVVSDAPSEVATFVLAFMSIHMMPVWIYLAGILTISRKFRNEAYIITDHAAYRSHGLFSIHYDTKPFADMSYIDIHRGIFDQRFKVGDVILKSSDGVINITDIPDYEKVYKMAKKLQEDIYSDIQFPNAYRPAENPGYRSEYNFVDDEKDRK